MSRSSAFGPSVSTDGDSAITGFRVQPHGLVLVVREPLLRVVQASANAAALIGRPLDTLLLATLADLGGDLETRMRELLAGAASLSEPQMLRGCLGAAGHERRFEGLVQRVGSEELAIELEPVAGTLPVDSVDHPVGPLFARLGSHVQAFGGSAAVATLAHAVAAAVREITGFDRVLVYELATQGPGRVIAESRRLPGKPPLGEPLAALEVPPPARAARLRQRLQAVVDVDAEPFGLLPHDQFGPLGAFDLSSTSLAAWPEARLQGLREIGVVASVSVAIVREGRLWGLIAGLHGRPRHLRQGVRAALELLAEAMATRIAAVESYARAQVGQQVRQLEQRLLEATSFDGDWSSALFADPRTLLQPLAATGAVLWHEGRCTTCGDVPPEDALAGLQAFLSERVADGDPWHCVSLAQESPAMALYSGTASGVLAVRLATSPDSHLVWLRPAAGPLLPDTALPWTGNELELASALARALVDLIVQVNAVRMLIAARQLSQLRATVAGAQEAVVVVADTSPGGFYANDAFYALVGRRRDECTSLEALTGLFTDTGLVRRIVGHLRAEQRSWQGELALRRSDGTELPVSMRAEPVPAGMDGLLGTIFILEDLTTAKRIEAARMRLEAALTRTGHTAPTQSESPEGQALVGAIIANASLAAMDIADSGPTPTAAPLLQEVETSTQRATALLARIRALEERRV